MSMYYSFCACVVRYVVCVMSICDVCAWLHVYEHVLCVVHLCTLCYVSIYHIYVCDVCVYVQYVVYGGCVYCESVCILLVVCICVLCLCM